jgi:hypothetical protein
MSGATGNADIDLLMPSLNFDVISSDANPIEIVLPLTADVDMTSGLLNGPFNLQGNLTIIASVEKLTQFDAMIGADVDVVVIDFRDLSDGDYSLEIVDDIEGKELLELIIKEMVRSTLQDETQRIAISPGVTHGTNRVQYFHMRVINDTTPPDTDYMDLLMNFSTTHTTPGPLNPFIRPDKDFALAISKELVDKQIDDKIKEKFGSLPARLPSDHSLILRSLHMALKNGYIRVWGSMTKEIDCWPDADVDFSGDVYLSVSPGGMLTANSNNVDVDLPWWADFLGAIIPVIGWIALAVIYDTVEDMIGDILAGQVSGAFSDLSLFPATIPQVGGMVESAPPFSTKNEAVEVREQGLIIHGRVIMDEKLDKTAYPLIGNKRTRELHYADCQWVAKMFEHNKWPFGRIDDALNMGYNGCWYCMKRFDTG